MELTNYTTQEIKQGFVFDEEKHTYTCLLCKQKFAVGEVFQIHGRFFEAKQAVQTHIDAQHPDYLNLLVDNKSKYNTLTETQKKLLHLFGANYSDKAIAKELGLSVSTVRHQKFSFREKAKQAKFYLAVFEKALQDNTDKKTDIIPIHANAKMVDDRYMTTVEEKERILNTFFTRLTPPMKLKEFPPKEKNKIVILSHIIEEFENEKEYTEKAVNEILGNIYSDYATLRRYLVMYGFMKRSRDGKKYWRL